MKIIPEKANRVIPFGAGKLPPNQLKKFNASSGFTFF